MKQWLIKTGIVAMCVLSVFISCSSDDDDDDDDPNWALLTFQRHHQQIENNLPPSDILAVFNK